ncbi:MAG: OmpA family protein [Deltaproteobacteria bacterium]|nr:OmpA family protein [Deltaproteobacteria bacterium]
MNRCLAISLCFSFMLFHTLSDDCYSQIETTPLEFLREQEIKHKDIEGEVYLGRVMTLTYPTSIVDADNGYHPLMLELSDVLKSPLRKNYRLVLKGYTDGRGSVEVNIRLSCKRAENLKKLLVKNPYLSMKEGRIATEGHGSADPVASNETAEGRRLNRRVEIHIYGDVTEAVRFIDK